MKRSNVENHTTARNERDGHATVFGMRKDSPTRREIPAALARLYSIQGIPWLPRYEPILLTVVRCCFIDIINRWGTYVVVFLFGPHDGNGLKLDFGLVTLVIVR